MDILKKSGPTAIDTEIPRLDELIATSPLYDVRSRSDLDRFLAMKRPGLTCHQILMEHQYHPSCDLFEDLARGPEDTQRKISGTPHASKPSLNSSASSCRPSKHTNWTPSSFPDAKIAAPLTSDVLEGRWPALQFPIITLIASQAKLPAVTVPVGLTEGGLPVGLELMEVLYREQCLLQLAYGVEALVKFNAVPNLGGEVAGKVRGRIEGRLGEQLEQVLKALVEESEES